MEKEVLAEFKSVIDDSIKENLGAIVGEQVTAAVEKHVQELRAERLLNNGMDKTGLTEDQKVKFIEGVQKAAYLSDSDQAGGYLVPTEVHAGILRIAATTGIVARDARKWPMGGPELEIPIYTGGVLQGGYVGEDEEGDESQADLGVARLNAKTWMTIFRVSNKLLRDASVDFADWLMSLAAEGLAYKLDREGFVGGTYTGSPFVGLLGSSSVTTQTLATGKTGFANFDLYEASKAIGTIPTAVVGGSAFYFHRTVWAEIVALEDSNGQPIFNQNNADLARFKNDEGISPVGVIRGYPVYTTDVLPALSSSAISTKFGVFGNLKQALAWGDRGPMEIAKSTDANVGGKSMFRANQTALRFTHDHAIVTQLGAAAVVFKTAAS